MRILIDMQGAQSGSRHRGIGRYTLSFVEAVLRNSNKHEIVLVFNGLFPDVVDQLRLRFKDLLPMENIRVWSAPGPVREEQVGNQNRREVAEIIREAFIESLQPDIIHITSLFEGYLDDSITSIGSFPSRTPVSVVLYDLIPLLNPTQYLQPFPAYESYYLRKIEHLKRASVALAISDFSREEGIASLGLNEVISISTAIDSNFSPCEIDESEIKAIKRKFNIKLPFILYTGATDERKNLPRLIEAFSLLPLNYRTNYQLVLAGGLPNDHRDALQNTALNFGLNANELVITGRVSDREMLLLYVLCELFVFPSWHEGFGIPLLEAMACGAAVIGSNVTSIPEVIGMNRALFDPFQPPLIAEKILEVLEDDGFRKQLKVHGLKQAQNFSWDKTAKIALSAWERVVQKNHHGLTRYGQERVLYKKLLTCLAQKLSDSEDGLSAKEISICLHANEQQSRKRKLFVDISEFHSFDAGTGIQRVVRSILDEWLKVEEVCYQVEPVYATETDKYRYAHNFINKFLGIVGPELNDEPIDFCEGDIFFCLDLSPHLQIAKAEFYKEMQNKGVKIFFLVHDLLCVRMPQYFPPGAYENFSSWLQIVAKSNGVICVSRATADDFLMWLDEKRINHGNLMVDWVHNGVDFRSRQITKGIPDDAQFLLKHFSSRPTFIMVGTIEPRKGHEQVLDAFEYLWDSGKDINLVIVGKQGWMVDQLCTRIRKNAKAKKNLFWLSGISDEYMEKIISACSCLIAASYGEGFGLPIIEAASKKIPIIARSIPVFREVAGGAAFYFDETTAIGLSKKILEWIELHSTNKAPPSEGIQYLTWEQSAAKLMKKLINQGSVKDESN